VTIDSGVVAAAITALATALGAAARMIYSDLRKDRDYWRDVAVKALGHTDVAIEAVAKKADGA
jgi:hypothetical protein